MIYILFIVLHFFLIMFTGGRRSHHGEMFWPIVHRLRLNIECVIFFFFGFLDALAHNFKQTTSSRFSMHQCEVCHKGFTGFMKQALRCVGKWGNDVP